MRPLVLILTIIAFGFTFIFKADVNAQGGAYATGVLVLMSSAAVAVTISALRRKENRWAGAFAQVVPWKCGTRLPHIDSETFYFNATS